MRSGRPHPGGRHRDLMTAQLFLKRAAAPLGLMLLGIGLCWWGHRPSAPSASSPSGPSSTPANPTGVPGRTGARPKGSPPDPTRQAQAEGVARGTNDAVAGAWARWSERSPFRDWTARYLAAASDVRPALAEEGVALAAARRPVFKQLITTDPREALRQAVPPLLRQELPAAVVEQLEERVNERAALRVYQGVGADNQSPVPTVR